MGVHFRASEASWDKIKINKHNHSCRTRKTLLHFNVLMRVLHSLAKLKRQVNSPVFNFVVLYRYKAVI